MRPLDSQVLKEFLKKATETLKGEWLLVGGTLLPALGISYRNTVDIDLVGLGPKETAQSLELMKLSEDLGLSIETINQAASYFVHKLGYEESDLLPLQKGKHCTIYRPSCQFYWKLKIARLSDSDLDDCRQYYLYCSTIGDIINKKALMVTLRKQIALDAPPSKRANLECLLDLIDR